MNKDPRIRQLVCKVLTESIKLQPNEKIYLEFEGEQILPVMEEFIRQTVQLGGVPFYFFNDTAHHIALSQGCSEEQMFAFGQIHAQIMQQMDAYVVVRGYTNPYNKTVLTAEEQSLYNRGFMGPVHYDIRINKRWMVMRWPTDAAAALAKMSTAQFEDFYFNACLFDYSKFEQAARPLADLLAKTNRVSICGPDTCLNFSIEGIKPTISHGVRNLPDGEVYTAPVKDSINGTIRFNTEKIIRGEPFSNIRLEFDGGKVVDTSCSSGNIEKLHSIIYTDAGSCYVGEFAFGLNPHIAHTVGEGLFDEKIIGSIHMALGNHIPSSSNGNHSAIHEDLVMIMRPEYGGGKIFFDGQLVYEDGQFVLEELAGLNR